MNVKIGFPKNPSLATTLPGGVGGGRGLLGKGGGSVWETEIREGAVVSPVEGAAGLGPLPPSPLPMGRGSGRPTGALWR